MSKVYFTPLLFISLAILLSKPARAQIHIPTNTPTFFTYFCKLSAGNYTTNSKYHANLNRILSALTTHSTDSHFHNTNAGSAPATRVYGQYYCRADVTSGLCHACVTEAAQHATSNCSNVKSAFVWFEECTLFYTNYSTVGLELEHPRSWWYSSTNVSDPSAFSQVLGDTMDRLVNETASEKGLKMFATGEGKVAPSGTVYCLAQCSPDINGTACRTCLNATLSFLPTCCGDASKWAFVFFPSCQVRYSLNQAFYQLPGSSPSLQPALAPTPAPALTASPRSPPQFGFVPAPAPVTLPTSPPPVTGDSPSAPSSSVKGGSTMLRCNQSMKLRVLIMALSLLVLKGNFN